MRRTAQLVVVILALVVVILALAAGGLLWKGDVPDLPDPESPYFSLNPPGWDPDPEYDSDLYDLNDLIHGMWPLPGEESDGALGVEGHYIDY